MNFFQELQKGFRFQTCGVLGENLVFPDGNGDLQRFIRVVGYGKTYNLEVDSDSKLAELPPVGTPVRALGIVLRRNRATTANPKISDILWPGKPNWKDPTEQEFMAGCVFAGWGMLMLKRGGEFRGNVYRKIQVSGWGDTYEFKDIPEEVFDSLPDRGAVYIQGRLEPMLSAGRSDEQRITVSDSAFVVEKIRVGEPAERPAERGREAKPAA